MCSGRIASLHRYVGPRAYDRHFHEWRHTNGLKCLGIVPDLFKYFHGERTALLPVPATEKACG